jgi:hypothetical protein
VPGPGGGAAADKARGLRDELTGDEIVWQAGRRPSPPVVTSRELIIGQSRRNRRRGLVLVRGNSAVVDQLSADAEEAQVGADGCLAGECADVAG